MRKTVFTVCVAILLIAAPGVFGQSNTNTATEGIFKTDVDKVFSVTDFSEIQAGMLGYIRLNGTSLDLGYARKLGGLYLGGFYAGNIVGYFPYDFQQVNTTYLLDPVDAIIGTTTQTLHSMGASTSHFNAVGAMLGFGTIGVQPGVWETSSASTNKFTVNAYAFNSGSTTFNLVDAIIATGASNSDSVTQTTDAAGTVIAESSTLYDNGVFAQEGLNSVNPWVNAGAELALGSVVLKPEVSLTVSFEKGETTAGVTTVTKSIGSGLPAYNSIADVLTYDRRMASAATGFIDLNGGVGVTAILGASSATQTQVSLGYSLGSLPLYNNSYTDLDGAAQHTNGRVWTWGRDQYDIDALTHAVTVDTYRVIQFESRQYSSHTVLPGIQMTTRASDAFSYGFSFMPSVVISNETLATTGVARWTQTLRENPDVVTPGTDYVSVENKTFTGSTVAESILTVNLPLAGAIQYYVVPSLVRLNGGVTATLPRWRSTKTTTTRPGLSTDAIHTTLADGTVVQDTYIDTLGSTRVESQDMFDSWSQANVDGSLGVTWFITKAVTLDLLLNAGGFPTFDVSRIVFQLSVAR